MVKHNLLDLHIHSDNSRDARHSVTLICEKAVERGIRAIAITDHCECREYRKGDYPVICRQSAFETRKAMNVFEGQIAIASGVELGSPAAAPDVAGDVMKNNFDFIVASVHRLKGRQKDIRELDYTRGINRPDRVFSAYLDEIAETVEWNGFDALAHLTYPLRWFPAELAAKFSLMRYKEQIGYILQKLAKNGRALEISTAGGEYETADIKGGFHPCFEIVKMFKDAGGEFITVGSDAHSADRVGDRVSEAAEMAEEAGFKYISFYQNRIPVQITIE